MVVSPCLRTIAQTFSLDLTCRIWSRDPLCRAFLKVTDQDSRKPPRSTEGGLPPGKLDSQRILEIGNIFSCIPLLNARILLT